MVYEPLTDPPSGVLVTAKLGWNLPVFMP